MICGFSANTHGPCFSLSCQWLIVAAEILC